MTKNIRIAVMTAVLFGGWFGMSEAATEQTVREFNSQKIGVCCYVEAKNFDVIPDQPTKVVKEVEIREFTKEVEVVKWLPGQTVVKEVEVVKWLPGEKVYIKGDNVVERVAMYPDQSEEVSNLQAENQRLQNRIADLQQWIKNQPKQVACAVTPVIFKSLAASEFFGTGSAELTGAGVHSLAVLAVEIKKESGPGAVIYISGHTDSRSIHNAQFENNQALSEARATTVMNAMIMNGLIGTSMTSTGFGATKPVATNKTEVGMASNRRVEITIMPDGGK